MTSEPVGSMLDVQTLQRTLWLFARDRDWHRFLTPRNLTMALAGEVGELLAEMQWCSDDELVGSKTNDEDRYNRIVGEIADVTIYLLQLCDLLEVDLADSVSAKIALNAQRFPPAEE